MVALALQKVLALQDPISLMTAPYSSSPRETHSWIAVVTRQLNAFLQSSRTNASNCENRGERGRNRTYNLVIKSHFSPLGYAKQKV